LTVLGCTHAVSDSTLIWIRASLCLARWLGHSECAHRWGTVINCLQSFPQPVCLSYFIKVTTETESQLERDNCRRADTYLSLQRARLSFFILFPSNVLSGCSSCSWFFFRIGTYKEEQDNWSKSCKKREWWNEQRVRDLDTQVLFVQDLVAGVRDQYATRPLTCALQHQSAYPMKLVHGAHEIKLLETVHSNTIL
jgi:hypothetical protein